MPKEGEDITFKNYERSIKNYLPFMIYVDFEIIVISEDNGKQNPNESCNCGYKSVFVNDKFSKPFKSYIGKDAFYNFISSSMTEESKNCSDMMKKHFNKELVMTKEGNEDFENSTKCLICDNDNVDRDVKVRDHCHITGKYRGSAHRDCNTNVNHVN